jgi:hypothetical protein
LYVHKEGENMVMLVLASLITATPAYGIDWSDGLVRMPAMQVGHLDGTWHWVRPDDERLGAMLWEVLKDVRISHQRKVRDVFPNARSFIRITKGVPGKVRKKVFEIPLQGRGGVVERILCPENFDAPQERRVIVYTLPSRPFEKTPRAVEVESIEIEVPEAPAITAKRMQRDALRIHGRKDQRHEPKRKPQ